MSSLCHPSVSYSEDHKKLPKLLSSSKSATPVASPLLAAKKDEKPRLWSMKYSAKEEATWRTFIELMAAMACSLPYRLLQSLYWWSSERHCQCKHVKILSCQSITVDKVADCCKGASGGRGAIGVEWVGNSEVVDPCASDNEVWGALCSRDN